MTKIEIIEETVEFYSEDTTRRAIVYPTQKSSNCLYNTADGRHCAVGRCFLPLYKAMSTDFEGNSGYSVERLLDLYNLESLDGLLEERYRGHSLDFWVGLQGLHDSASNWDFEGLTEEGEIQLKRLISLNS